MALYKCVFDLICTFVYISIFVSSMWFSLSVSYSINCLAYCLCFVAESRIGRQPNAVKHATFLQLCRIKSAKGITASNNPFAVSKTRLNLTEAGGNNVTVAAANDLPDFAVTTSRDSRMISDGWKKPRRPYRRRSVKVTSGVGDGSDRQHYADSTQPCLSPVTIKQEAASLVECDTNELLDELGAELVQDFCEEENSTVELHPEQVDPSCGMQTRNSDNVECYCCTSDRLSDDLQATASSPAALRLDPCLPVPQCDNINTTIPASASSQAPQPSYDDVIKSMQGAYYDLLPILVRVCDAVLCF